MTKQYNQMWPALHVFDMPDLYAVLIQCMKIQTAKLKQKRTFSFILIIFFLDSRQLHKPAMGVFFLTFDN